MDKKVIAKLALGTVQFGLDYGICNEGGKTSQADVKEILELAHQSGITLLDTAQAYGTSEEVLGSLASNRFKIVTKLSPAELEKLSAEDLVNASLSKLNLKQLYAVLFHNAQSALGHPQAVEDLKREKRKGRITKYGYSVYTPEELEKLVSAYGIPDLIQVPYSHLDRRFEPQLKILKQKGVEIHTRSTFLQGLFFVSTYGLTEFFNPVKDYIIQLQRGFQNTSELAAYLLKFAVEQPFIDTVVIGVNDARQLKENLNALMDLEGILDLEAPQVNSEILMPNLWPKS